ncbi:MAG: alpha/beta hydrolase [Clostridiales bacterium]|nr:alpha/beta hydrolase [Clostridiales bacterium]
MADYAWHSVAHEGVDYSVYSLTEDPAAPLVYVLAEEATGVILARALAGAGVHLATIGGTDWFRDLTPWPAPSPFAGQDSYPGEADKYMQRLSQGIVPAIEQQLGLTPAWRGLCGYSLAGLFSLYAPYRTDLFLRVASVSGSLWYDGFVDYMQKSPLTALPVKAYFSLGDQEAAGRNPVLSRVDMLTQQAEEHLRLLGAQTVLEMNPGNHFVDIVPRLEKALRWLIQ